MEEQNVTAPAASETIAEEEEEEEQEEEETKIKLGIVVPYAEEFNSSAVNGNLCVLVRCLTE